jgi:hypothetical protein
MRCPHIQALGLMLLTAVIGNPDEVRAAPQTFNTALPVAKGNFIFRGQTLIR